MGPSLICHIGTVYKDTRANGTPSRCPRAVSSCLFVLTASFDRRYVLRCGALLDLSHPWTQLDSTDLLGLLAR